MDKIRLNALVDSAMLCEEDVPRDVNKIAAAADAIDKMTPETSETSGEIEFYHYRGPVMLPGVVAGEGLRADKSEPFSHADNLAVQSKLYDAPYIAAPRIV